MEILVGPTFSIQLSSPVDQGQDQDQDQGQDQDDLQLKYSASAAAVSNCTLLKDEDETGSHRMVSGIGINELHHDDNSTDSSSSIGSPDDSDEEVDSAAATCSKGPCLDSLEHSLPFKRGLSNHFSGKSKSFTNLADVSSSRTVEDLVKPEDPFNKRRRILMANKLLCRRRKSSFYSWANPKSMPLLALPEEEVVEEEEEEEEEAHRRGGEDNRDSSSSAEQQNHHRHQLEDSRLKARFMSHSCLSLTDLQEEDHFQ